jgi:small subunit ribosomal protein S14
MAKKSATEKNARRQRLAKKYANKRAELKAIVMDRSLEPEERFAAQLKLNELPRNGAAVDVPGAIIESSRCRVLRFVNSGRWAGSQDL